MRSQAAISRNDLKQGLLMISDSNPIILIPARMNSTRLPNKPLADINGIPMIVRVWQIAVNANLGRVIVASGDSKISEAVQNEGGEAILTDPALPSGSDRIFAALEEADPFKKHNIIINLQGDLPVLERSTITAAYKLMENDQVDIGTVAAKITIPEEKLSPSIVKAIVAWNNDGIKGRALYFSKEVIPYTNESESKGRKKLVYHHIGVYAYKSASLETYLKIPISHLEEQEGLEQLRFVENGISVKCVVSCLKGKDFWELNSPSDVKIIESILKSNN